MEARARRAAKHIHADLQTRVCPGGEGHEGTGADFCAADYCNTCIEAAIAAAYQRGYEAALSSSSRAA